MICRFTDFINTRLQPSAETRVAGEPFQRLSIIIETVETVLSSLYTLHPAEAGC
jgi:hypothetical protein